MFGGVHANNFYNPFDPIVIASDLSECCFSTDHHPTNLLPYLPPMQVEIGAAYRAEYTANLVKFADVLPGVANSAVRTGSVCETPASCTLPPNASHVDKEGSITMRLM